MKIGLYHAPHGGVMGAPFRILSLDGGGVRGAYGAGFLARCEHLGNHRTQDSFDLIVGTSTGAILGAALAAGCPASGVMDLYQSNARSIFRKRALGFFRSRYSRDMLAKDVDRILGDTTFENLDTALCITAIDGTTGKLRVFKTPHWSECQFDHQIPVRDAVLASAAAPVFFRGHEIQDELYPDAVYVDGGLAANNPSLLGLSEAFHYFDKKPNEIELLSLGTGGLEPVARSRVSSGSLLRWRQELVTRGIGAQGNAVHDLVRMVAEKTGIGYYRSSPDDLVGASLDSWRAVADYADRGRTDADNLWHHLKPVFFDHPTAGYTKHARYNPPNPPGHIRGSFWYSSRDP